MQSYNVYADETYTLCC